MFKALYHLILLALPDKCEMTDCERQGVRGNENRYEGMVMCDYCLSKFMHLKYVVSPTTTGDSNEESSV